MAKEMTKREFLNAVANGEINETLIEFAKTEIAKLDATNKKRAEKKSADQAATDKVVIGFVTADYTKAKAITESINATLDEKADKYSVSKVVASLKRLSDEGKVKIKEERDKSRYVKLYALA